MGIYLAELDSKSYCLFTPLGISTVSSGYTMCLQSNLTRQHENYIQIRFDSIKAEDLQSYCSLHRICYVNWRENIYLSCEGGLGWIPRILIDVYYIISIFEN